jgi:hypothetical protein
MCSNNNFEFVLDHSIRVVLREYSIDATNSVTTRQQDQFLRELVHLRHEFLFVQRNAKYRAWFFFYIFIFLIIIYRYFVCFYLLFKKIKKIK